MREKISWLIYITLPIIVAVSILALSRDITVRNYEWPGQMQYTPASVSQSVNPVLPNGLTQQMPVPGTIPKGYQPFHYSSGEEEAARAGRELINPFKPTPDNLTRGQQVYTNYCAVCHGNTGAGDGPIIPKYPNPPSYMTEKSKELPDGSMFHIVTKGRNNMPSHAAQVRAEDRWKVLLFIRKLQGKAG
jgi:mono/diheme cytochrome c family protein